MEPFRALKDWLRRRCPRAFLLLRKLWYSGRDELDPRSAALLERLSGREPLVQSGPFHGMRYLRASGSGLLPKIVGCYEREIQCAVLESLQRGYRTVLNVGAGEGYYAVGYALRLPGAVVHAFDLDPLARQRLRKLAGLNGVSARVRVGGLCTPDLLQALLGPRSLVFSDCEGCEKELLDPERVPALCDADVLVELHDFLDPSISRTLLARLACSHDVRLYPAEERGAADEPLLRDLAADERDLAVQEGRPAGMHWAWLKARSW
jgi:hypothetical protein